MKIALPTDQLEAWSEGPIGWLRFNNPARRNAVTLAMWSAIPEALAAFEADPEIRVIVLHGAGNQAFVAGADISEFETQRGTPEAIARYDAIGARATAALTTTTKPTIAMIRGFCIGGGVGIAVSCDLRIADDRARFGVPAARLGLGYGLAGVKQLMDLVGPAATKDIFFTARHLEAPEALAIGLVNRVVPTAELEAATRATCALIAANAPLTMHAVKRMVADLNTPRGADTAEAARLVAACFASDDYAEGRRAFMEKRKPVFRGR